ncbi:MAG: hypothetical protein KIT43_10470 [Bauldia sp.]|nr:hypothetical protein [Bauldia sp.]
MPDWRFVSQYYPMIIVDTATCPEHVVRWVRQGIDYGELVVPIGPLRGEPIKFLVFPIGAPADFVDGYIRNVVSGYTFGFAEGPERLTPEEIEALVHSAETLTRSDLATIVEGVAAAIPTPTYEAWRDGTDTAGRTVYWSHDEPIEVRAANAAAAWGAVTPSRSGESFLMAPYRRYLFAFIDFPTGEWDLFDRYRARWLTEAIEGGDTVFSYVSQPRATNNPPALRFAVIAAGSPPELVEPVLREYLRYYEPLFAENVEKVIRTWRDLIGLP